MITVNCGHTKRITLFAITNAVQSQWHSEMVKYGVEPDTVAIIQDVEILRQAIKKRKTVWIVTHNTLSTFKYLETTRAKQGRMVAVQEYVEFDRMVQMFMHKDWPELCTSTDSYLIWQRKPEDRKGKKASKASYQLTRTGKWDDLGHKLKNYVSVKTAHIEFHRVIIDKVHNAKNRNSILSKCLMRLTSFARHVWLLSATLVSNKEEHLFVVPSVMMGHYSPNGQGLQAFSKDVVSADVSVRLLDKRAEQ